MKEIVVTNGLRVRSEGIAITVTASMLLTKASGYLALKNPFKRTLFLFFVIFFFNVLSFFCLFVFIVQVRVSQYIYYFCSGFGHDASQNVAKSVLAEENFCSMLKWKT